MEHKPRKKVRRTFGAVIAAIIFLAFVAMALWQKMKKENEWLDYPESLDMVAVEVNGQPLTLRDMAFYIAYDEQVVEEQAQMYDEEDSTRYWNLFINHDGFVRLTAKKATMEKAIHDEIFYRMALEENVELEKEDDEELNSAEMLFWNSIMFGDKIERLGVTEETLNNSIRKVALAQKYQRQYAEKQDEAMEEYDSTGGKYLKMREQNQISVKDEVWDKVHYGDVSLDHENGIFQGEKEEDYSDED